MELNSVDAANDQHRMSKIKLHPGTETNSSCSELSGCCQMALMMNQRGDDQTKKSKYFLKTVIFQENL